MPWGYLMVFCLCLKQTPFNWSEADRLGCGKPPRCVWGVSGWYHRSHVPPALEERGIINGRNKYWLARLTPYGFPVLWAWLEGIILRMTLSKTQWVKHSLCGNSAGILFWEWLSFTDALTIHLCTFYYMDLWIQILWNIHTDWINSDQCLHNVAIVFLATTQKSTFVNNLVP